MMMMLLRCVALRLGLGNKNVPTAKAFVETKSLW